ncbi:MAG: histidine phosphatase family protein [Oscillospiraceae bacterium]|nr:histidine phosphatase family protein [Oscillospiraceae bacterium]
MIYIVRHGQTEMNHRKALQGRSDAPLDEIGVAQAQSAAEKLKDIRFDRVYTSPLIRAIQTARIIAPYAEPVIENRLIEMDYGPYEGCDLTKLPPEIITFFSDFVHNPAPDGMEQLSAVVARVGSFLDEIRKVEGNILLSAHAISMKGMLEYLTPDANGMFWSKFIGNCSVYLAENRNGSIGVPKELF